MDIKQIVDTHFGGNASAMAREFKVTPAAIGYWRDKGMTPQREAQIQLWILQNSPSVTPSEASPPQ